MLTALYFATQSDIRLSASCGKYNITLTVSQNITFRLALKISLFAKQTISLYLKLDLCYNKFMSESILREKAKEFAKNIVFITRDIKANNKESVLTNQLLRSVWSKSVDIATNW